MVGGGGRPGGGLDPEDVEEAVLQGAVQGAPLVVRPATVKQTRQVRPSSRSTRRGEMTWPSRSG